MCENVSVGLVFPSVKKQKKAKHLLLLLDCFSLIISLESNFLKEILCLKVIGQTRKATLEFVIIFEVV